MNENNLVFVGKIIELQPIPNADFIISATVICGWGGKWKGIVRKSDFQNEDLCVVFLPDSLLNKENHSWLPHMEKSNWRVKMMRFKGAPSEVLIISHSDYMRRLHEELPFDVGSDITKMMKVIKYHKPVPAHLQGISLGYFPNFIPKTDELNYQQYPELVDSLVGKNYFIAEKADGSSTTAYRYKRKFGVCSRNLELVRDENNGYWKIAIKYQLEENLPEGFALQWETCGPGVQSNPMELKDIEGFAFSAYNIPEHRYLELTEFSELLDKLKFPSCKIIEIGSSFSKEGIELLGEGFYENGKHREGVVVRSQMNVGNKPISFKVINLNYES